MTTQLFSVTAEEVLSTIPQDEIYFSFEKKKGNIYLAIDFSNDGDDSECTVYVLDGIYQYIKTFYGINSLEKGLKYANSKMTSKYLSSTAI